MRRTNLKANFFVLLFTIIATACCIQAVRHRRTEDDRYHDHYHHPSHRPDEFDDAPPVQVTVFYETRCPYSKRFIDQELLPTYDTLGDRVMNVTFVPFGLALTEHSPYRNDNLADYVCQHGIDECIGNNLQACYVLSQEASAQTQRSTLEFIRCMMISTKPMYTSVRACSKQIDGGGVINTTALEQCAYNQRVYPRFVEILAAKTNSTSVPVNSVPYVQINGELNQFASHGLLKFVCRAFQSSDVNQKQGVKPDACRQRFPHTREGFEHFMQKLNWKPAQV